MPADAGNGLDVLEPVYSLGKSVFLCKREQVKPLIYLLSRYASNACPCGSGTARAATRIACEARERVGEDSKTFEKQ